MTGREPAVPDHRSAEVIARVNRLELRVDDLDQLFPLPAQTSTPGDAEEDGEALGAWVGSFFAVTFARSTGGEHRWCPRWAEHPEAVFRLQALHRAQLMLRAESQMGDATWLRDYLDPQLGVLLSARGPFALCSRDRHDLLLPLPSETSIEVNPMAEAHEEAQ